MICCGLVLLHRSSLPTFAGGHSISQLLGNLTWASPLFNGASQISPAAKLQRHEVGVDWRQGEAGGGGGGGGETCGLTWGMTWGMNLAIRAADAHVPNMQICAAQMHAISTTTQEVRQAARPMLQPIDDVIGLVLKCLEHPSQ